MGASVGCCTQREDERGADSDGTVLKLPPASPWNAPSPTKSEPEGEPDMHHEEHQDFVRGLRLRLASEEHPDYWSVADLEGEAAPSRCVAMRKALEDLQLYYADWQASGHDVFWQRKSKQVVLAVVVCQAEDGSLASYRGMNTEVSLPAGSLCAERAAIARAASELRAAHDIAAVAVLDPSDRINPLWPCEVCQSWLAKLRDQSAAIHVLAVADCSCSSFVVRVNGVLQPRPLLSRCMPCSPLLSQIQLAEGVSEQPWEVNDLVYVDGGWDNPGAEHWALLKAAKAKGAHVLAGIHSDETLRSRLGAVQEPFDARLLRLLEDRHVSSVLTDAPWILDEALIQSLGIRHVLADARTPEGKEKAKANSYQAAADANVLTFLPAP